MHDLRKLLLALVLITAAGQPAAPQANNSQPAESQEVAAARSAKLTEATKLSLEVVKLHGQGKFEEALPLAERAVGLREEVLGRDHLSVAHARKNLGAIYLARGKADKGRQHYLRALSIYEKSPAENTANIYKLLDALGLLERFAFNNFSNATEHYERSLALKESSLGAEHEEVIKTLYELAELYELHARNDKALAVHRRIIAVSEKHEAANPYNLLAALNRFICLSERLGLKPETAEARQRVEEIRTREDEKREREAAAQPQAEIAGGKIVRGGVLNGIAISKPAPVYPEAALRNRITGTVTIFLTVDESGRVIEAYPCGHPLLSEAALRAAYAAKFSPTLLSGVPVKVRGIITYNFVLR